MQPIPALPPVLPRALRAAPLLGALLLPSCAPREAAEPATLTDGVRPREAPIVRTDVVVQREMVQYLETTTVLESEAEIDLFPRSTGEIVEVLAEEGDRVEAGDALARLDDRDQLLAVADAEVALEEARNAVEQAVLSVEDALASVASARLAAEQAQRDYDRDLRLFESQEVASPLSTQALETRRLERDNARAALEQAEIAHRRAELEERQSRTAVERATVALDRARFALQEREILAPFDGVVSQRAVRVGAAATAGAFAFKLTDPLHLRAVFNRPQRELPMFRGSADSEPIRITAVAEALPDQAFVGRIVRISPTIDPLSGNFRVTAVLDRESEGEVGPQLLPGMLLRLRIATERHPDALVVPKRAVRREGDRAYLFAVEDGRLREVEVSEGFTDEENVEVLPAIPGSLTPGTAVVVVGNRDLEEGIEVQVDTGDDEPDAGGEEASVVDEETPAGGRTE